MKKVFLLSTICVIALFGCDKKTIPLESTSVKESTTEEIVRINNLCNGDAMFWNNSIVTATNFNLTIIQYKDSIKIQTYKKVNAVWMDGIDEENIIVYGNYNHEIGLCRFDNNLNLIEHTVLMKNDLLGIDPAIIKVKNEYFLSITFIDGLVNNADPEVENGHYKVKLYKSKDFYNWEYVSTVVDEYYNIEDTILVYDNNCLYIVYEQETYDRGPSNINLVSSNDLGKTWDTKIELIPRFGDNEPANIKRESKGWTLYYTSDLMKTGESYNGASVYKATYNLDFTPIQIYTPIQSMNSTGKLLYDVYDEGEGILLLITENYLTDKNLIVEKHTLS